MVLVGDVLDVLEAEGLKYETGVRREVPLSGPVGWWEFKGEGFAFCVYEDAAVLEKWSGHEECLIVCPESLRSFLPSGPYLFTEFPRTAFALSSRLFLPPAPKGIHPSAVIDPKAVIGKNPSIGPLAVIGAATIGDNAVIGSHVSISEHVTLGNDVVVGNGAHLGCDGLGSVKDNEGRLRLFPHFGDVVVEDGVVFGAGAIVFRGVLSTTRIGAFSHISAKCFVGHNVVVGKGVFCAPTSHLAGSVVVDDGCWLGQGSAVRDGVRIPANTVLGMNVALTRSPDQPGQTFIGSQAKSLGGMFGAKRS